MTGSNTSSSRTRLSGATDHRILIIFSLLAGSAVLTAYKTRSLWWRKLLIRKCRGCSEKDYHTHHFSILGKWHYVWRYRLLHMVVPDNRPQPPVGEHWFAEYAEDWMKQYPDMQIRSAWVRDETGFWVWCTDTPGYDRDWFDAKGWQFPARWITFSSKDFYKAGADELSTIVSIEGKIDAKEDVSQ